MPDIITYRHHGLMVYVPPSDNYDQAIACARDVFPTLAHLRPDAIVICVNAIVNGQRQPIRISPMAWPTVLSTLSRFEVLDILLKLPQIVVDSDPALDPDSLPSYDDLKQKSDAAPLLAPSRVPSPSYIKNVPLPELRAARARSSPSPSRSPSPSSPAPSIVSDLARSLFGKRAN